MKTAQRKGFTLIELLVVIGILAILLTIVLIAINPARQFGLSNDTKRRSEVLAILNAVHQYAADPAHKGSFADLAIPATATEIGDTTGMVDICDDLVPNYISALPVDPDEGTGEPITDCTAAYETGYEISQDAAGRVTVSAPLTSTYTTTDISITR